ncbi:alkaline ceramidase 3 [Colletotrichum spaethianum]|uniref:Alkaline ceramidase 3 n=1 Tax=Colletotrichum spaethianum TaxID=700344 RepID=A0AA37P6L0_9PEZI|nr:alkaline ceramidase 3 [Colletotrichum spaethianum]GKT39934.1 alkaline ceramidase 3 [Colletotrichum spaethianum]
MASSPLFQALRLAYNEDVPDGYWGEKTSTLNFCEEDYAVSYYCAEVCNVSTNQTRKTVRNVDVANYEPLQDVYEPPVPLARV